MNFANGPHGSENAERNRPPLRRVLTDAQGRFGFAGVAPVEWTLLVDQREHAPHEQTVALSKGARPLVRVTLTAGSVVHGVITDSSAVPIEGVSVFTWRDLRAGLRYTRSVRSDGSAAYELAGLPHRAGTPIRAVRTGTPDAADTVLDLEPSARVEWSPVVGPPSGLSGVVIGPDGEPLEGWIVTASGPGGIRDMARSRADRSFSLDEDMHDARDLSGKRHFSDPRDDAFFAGLTLAASLEDLSIELLGLSLALPCCSMERQILMATDALASCAQKPTHCPSAMPYCSSGRIQASWST